MKNRTIYLSLLPLLAGAASMTCASLVSVKPTHAAVKPAHPAAKMSPPPFHLPAGIDVGSYRVTALPGWHKKVVERQAKKYHEVWQGKAHDYTIGYGKSVAFTKKAGLTTISLEFGVDRHPTEITIEEVTAASKKYEDEIVKQRFKNHLPGTVLKSEASLFRGRPAYLSQTRGPSANGVDVIDTRTVTFPEGHDVYTITETLTGLELHKAEKPAAQGFDALTKGLYRTKPLLQRAMVR